MDGQGTRQRRSVKPQELFETIAEHQPSQGLKPHQTCPTSPTLNYSPTRSPQCPPSPSLADGDKGAGPKKRISLSDPGWLPKLCSCIPGAILFPPLFMILVSALFSQRVSYLITAVLSVYITIYTSNLSISCALGFLELRRGTQVDWHAKLKQLQQGRPEASNVMHIVFLPNYKEAEDMMLHTLKNLAKAGLARETMHVVLAMEEREGQQARDKAASLIDATRHLFADIFATFHPADIPGDVPGKSSNVQWAYRKTLQRFAAQLNKYDASQVFMTSCDADTLFHPQYFSAMTYQGLCMQREERIWTLWQPPVLLLRNLFSCPQPTRLSGYATILFEMAGLANQKFGPHFSYSAYSTTLALASHSLVDGWDRDVIAEDHHMFCKCYFASIWEQVQSLGFQECAAKGKVEVRSQVRLSPVWLPAISYLVEADGWFSSVYARFLQARRHSQGQAEISYSCLQHMHLLKSEQARCLSLSTHLRILTVPGKMACVHIISTLHSVGVVIAALLVILGLILSLDVSSLVHTATTGGIRGVLGLLSFGNLKWMMFAIFGTIPPMAIMMSFVTYLVVRDTLEGRMTADAGISKKVGPTDLVAPDIQGSARGPNGLGWWGRFRLCVFLHNDTFNGGVLTMILYGVIPASQAAWSLLRTNGAGFKYIVGSKPTEAS